MTGHEGKRRALTLAGVTLVAAAAVGGAATYLRGIYATSAEAPDHDAGASAPLKERIPTVNPLETELHRAHLEATVEKVQCEDCHEIQVDTFLPPDRDRCLACHREAKVTVHAAASDATTTQCRTCHDFRHAGDWRASAWSCTSCHEMPQGKARAIAVHATEACGQCHRPHTEPTLAPRNCVDCHGNERAHHGKMSPGHADGRPDTEICLTCHHPHEPAETAQQSCIPCHETGEHRVASTATFPGGHERCTSCHVPHDFTRRGVHDCRSCHARGGALASAKVAKHADCTSCHDQHDPLGRARASCATCHAKLRPDHPVDAAQGTCLGCHPPHPKGAAVAAACSGCHDKASSDKGFHEGGVECKSCHAPHAFTSLEPAVCKGCHELQGQRVVHAKGHQDCTKCHTPHTPKVSPPTCASCHEEQGKAVIKDHATCTSCHEPHSGGRSVQACSSCHAIEVSSAPKGHANCLTCHEPHKGSRKVKSCVDGCHATEGKTPHGSSKDGCAQCHRAHGPKGQARPPSCQSCHESGTLVGMHLVMDHVKCESCHSEHALTKSSKRFCLTECHQGMRDHYPDAESCLGCHGFRGKQ